MSSAAKVFSPQTLEKFEAAAASIPLRPLDRAFEVAGVRLGKDPGGPDGARRVQFRRYVASVDQRDAQQLDRLGVALGALIDEVAESKQLFLVTAAQSDGFAFAGGVFRPMEGGAQEPTADLTKRLHALADDHPNDAIAASKQQIESTFRLLLATNVSSAQAHLVADVAIALAASVAKEKKTPRR